MANQIDFKGLALELLARSRELVPCWIPGGKFRGREYVAGSIRGGDGDSFACNLDTGLWADFADSDCKGGDLISLYASIKGVKQGEAARELSDTQGYDLTQEPPPPKPPEPQPELPPEGMTHDCFHIIHGEPSAKWEYKDSDGRLMFYIARYDTPEGKQIVPWSWVENEWKAKGWPAPRPLYGLPLLKTRPNAPIIVAEGEKAADAIQSLLRGYNVITWPNGAQAYKKADWSPLYDKPYVLIWPDADEPGYAAREGITEILKTNGVKTIKAINTDGWAEGWDAADEIAQEYVTSSKELMGELKKRVYLLNDAATEGVVEKKASEPEPPTIIRAENVDAENAIVQINQYSSDDIPTEAPESAEYWYERLGLVMQRNMTPANCQGNAAKVISGHPRYAGTLAFDTFYDTVQIRQEDGSYIDWRTEDHLFITDFIQCGLGMAKTSREDVYHAAQLVGYRNKKNEPKDWMESLVWDGVPRVKKFFVDYYIAEDSDYMRMIAQNFWVGMVARVYKPGCKLDNMVILEGPQGIFKSKSLEIIGGKWYSVISGVPDTRDFFLQLRGKILVEIAELDSFRKVESTLVKKILTQPFDRYRDPYGMTMKDNYRTCIFAGTTNEEEYLKDSTGARRFWPIRIGRIDLDGIASDRDQLFAEAVYLYKHKATWWEVPDQAFNEQEERREGDIWEAPISEYLFGKFQCTVQEVAIECLKIDIGKVDQFVKKRILKILKVMKWERHRSRRDGSRQYVFTPPSTTEDF